MDKIRGGKTDNLTRFDLARPWSAKNGSDRVGPPLANKLDTTTRSASEEDDPSLFFSFNFYLFFFLLIFVHI